VRTKVSVVIACYRDGPAVAQMYRRLVEVLGRLEVDREIIFVNDASPDDAEEILAAIAAADPSLVVITHSRNFGSQAAFTSGMQVATGDVVVLMDGDLQDPPELIEAFYARWREGYEVVYGERVEREAAPHMRVAYKLFYRIFASMAYVKIPLDAGDFSMIDRRVVDILNAMPESQRFIRGLRAWAGFRQVGVPYVRPERPFGRTTNSFLGNLGWARRAIVSFSYAPLNLIAWMAVCTVVLALSGAAVQVLLRIVAPDIVPAGLTTVIVVILVMSSFQLICLAVLGSYMAHIYEEVKRRPPFIVSRTINAPGERPAGDPAPLAETRSLDAGLGPE
jgi:polyisoprenyl-phosphate glycosyltransferase